MTKIINSPWFEALVKALLVAISLALAVRL